MFSGKMKYYDKPCKWLNFLLNVIFPLMVLGSLYEVITMAAGWETFAPIKFVQDIIFIVAFLIIDLLARFLDKTAFVSLIVGHGIAIVNDIFAMIVIILSLKAATGAINSATDGGFIGGMVNSYIGFASGLMAAGEIIGTLIFMLIYSASLAYVISRRKLFLTSEEEMKADQDFE